MLLPKKILEQIEFYSITMCSSKTDWDGVDDVITLYFKSRWKFRKTIKIRRITTKIFEDGNCQHDCSPETTELIEQLKNWAAASFVSQSEKITTVKILTLVPNEKDKPS